MPRVPHYISPMRFRLNLTFALLSLAVRLHAQVGHPPSTSPYRDILYNISITPYVGWIGGDGGDIGVGPHDGVVYGARVDYRLSNTLSLGANFESGVLDRLIVDADDPVDARVTGGGDTRRYQRLPFRHPGGAGSAFWIPVLPRPAHSLPGRWALALLADQVSQLLLR